MILVKRLVLDILKPHQPDAVDFCLAIAAIGDDYRISLTVIEMDDKTQTTQVEIEAGSIDFDAVKESITEMSCSLHSIDVVEVKNEY
jgi:hypothetical protein